MEFEYRIGHLLIRSERARIGIMQFHRRARNDGQVAFYFLEEIRELPGSLGLIGKSPLYDDVLTGLPKCQRRRAARKVGDWFSVKAIRYCAGTPNLVVA